MDRSFRLDAIDDNSVTNSSSVFNFICIFKSFNTIQSLNVLEQIVALLYWTISVFNYKTINFRRIDESRINSHTYFDTLDIRLNSTELSQMNKDLIAWFMTSNFAFPLYHSKFQLFELIIFAIWLLFAYTSYILILCRAKSYIISLLFLLQFFPLETCMAWSIDSSSFFAIV